MKALPAVSASRATLADRKQVLTSFTGGAQHLGRIELGGHGLANIHVQNAIGIEDQEPVQLIPDNRGS